MHAFKELVATSDEVEKYFSDNFDPDAEFKTEFASQEAVMRTIKTDNFSDFADCLQD